MSPSQVKEILQRGISDWTAIQQPIISALMKRLKSSDDTIRTECAKALGKFSTILSPERVSILTDECLNNLNSREAALRAGAIAALGQLLTVLPSARVSVVANTLLKSLRDIEPSVKSAVVDAIGRLPLTTLPLDGLASVVDGLIKNMEDDNTRVVAKEALKKLMQALSSEESGSVVRSRIDNGLIRNALNSSRAAMVSDLIELVGYIPLIAFKTEELSSLLDDRLKSLSDNEVTPRAIATVTLGRLPKKVFSSEKLSDVINALLKSLNSRENEGEYFVRASAVEALGSFLTLLSPDKASLVVNALQKMLEDNHPYVKEVAAKVLSEFPPAPIPERVPVEGVFSRLSALLKALEVVEPRSDLAAAKNHHRLE